MKTRYKLLTPNIFWWVLGLVWLIPVGSVLIASFLSFDLAKPDSLGQVVGIANYAESISRKQFVQSLYRSVFLIVLVLPLSLIIGAVIAHLISQLSGIIARLFLIVFSLPLFLPPVTSALIWYFQFSPDYGPLGYYVNEHFDVIFLSVENAMFSIAIVEVWKLTPLYILIFYMIFRSVPPSLKETRAIYGISLRTYISRFMIPLNQNVILLGFALGLIQISKAMESVFLITRGGPGTLTETFPLYIYKVIFERYEFGIGGSTAVIYDLILVALFFGIKYRPRWRRNANS